jgi:hypothetical protein
MFSFLIRLSYGMIRQWQSHSRTMLCPSHQKVHFSLTSKLLLQYCVCLWKGVYESRQQTIRLHGYLHLLQSLQDQRIVFCFIVVPEVFRVTGMEAEVDCKVKTLFPLHVDLKNKGIFVKQGPLCCLSARYRGLLDDDNCSQDASR